MKCYCITEYGRPLQLVDRGVPAPSGTQVLLCVKAAGVCHTDLHILEGGYDMGGGRTLKMSDRGQRLPHVMGHETVGEVVALGPDARGVAIGDVRLVYPWIGCGKCAACAADEEHLCMAPEYLGIFRDGGYADHIMVSHSRYLIDVNGLAPSQAAPYACSALTAYSALKKLGPAALEAPILIVGAGGLGLQSLPILKAMGGVGAIVVDLDAGKRAAALEAGALAAIDPMSATVTSEIATAAGGPLGCVVDFVVSPRTWELAFKVMRKGATYVVVGLFGGEVLLSLPALPLRALTVTGSFAGSRRELIELVALMGRSGSKGSPVTERPLSEVNEALSALKRGTQLGRAVLIP